MNKHYDESDLRYRLPYIIETGRLHFGFGKVGFWKWCDGGNTTWTNIKAAMIFCDELLEKEKFVGQSYEQIYIGALEEWMKVVKDDEMLKCYLSPAQTWVRNQMGEQAGSSSTQHSTNPNVNSQSAIARSPQFTVYPSSTTVPPSLENMFPQPSSSRATFYAGGRSSSSAGSGLPATETEKGKLMLNPL
ncbi:uncharacterized protein STEHIDRAFT_109666 [Stereum hirsutum FP-91666 SS1]|uniref:uncharacterized protein n=1 Tax=Stereum hirsutum (strain FP-91666) TaxID=721885 RepID=UPI0004410062|nr:uncharacterized protein STEHIDRAFT_109666 [Stereum hirsutum FP-91666 SS1]EIM87785.1 hypothetical protein STEHIDRAFT_109666 [Stereum hirsutum FP-91666 SS1]